MVHLLQLMHHYWYFTVKSMLYSYFLNSLLAVLFLQQDSIQDTTLHYLSRLLRFLLAVTVSQTCLVFDDLDSFEEDWSGILQDVPRLGFVWCFLLMIRLGVWDFVRKVTEVNHIMSRVYTITMTYHCWCWTWSEGVFGRFLHCKIILLFFLFPYCTLWKEGVLTALPTLKKLKLHSTSLWVANVQKLFVILLHGIFVSSLSFTYLFQLFTYISRDAWIFILYSEL